MKGATLLAAFQTLGVVPSFSRPRVSDDNPFSEALFRTLKYRPSFPRKPFETMEAARAWVADFVRWYNTEHRHSALRFVTPDQRHFGQEIAILSTGMPVDGTRSGGPVGCATGRRRVKSASAPTQRFKQPPDQVERQLP